MKEEIFLLILIDFCSKQLWRSISVCCECTVFCAKVRKKSHKLFPFTTDVPVCSDTQSSKVLLNQSCDSTGTGKTKINNETQLEHVVTLRWHAAFLVQGFVVCHCQLRHLGWMTWPGRQTLHQSHCQQLTDFWANYHSKWYSQRQLKSTDEKQEVLKKCWVELPWRS